MAARFVTESGTIVGSRPIARNLLKAAPDENVIITEPWRGSFSLYLNASNIAGLENFLSFRVYARNGGTRALVRQFLYHSLFPEPAPGMPGLELADPQHGKRDVFLGRIAGLDCEHIEVTACVPQVVNPNNSDAFVVTYASGNPPPTPFDVDFVRRFRRYPLIPPPPGTVEPTKFQLTAIHGTLHQLWATNAAATDTWLWLFDDASFRTGYAFPPGNTAQYSRVSPLYVPPNGKGLASLDFGRAGLAALWGHMVVASTSATSFTYDAGAVLGLTAELS